MEKVSVDMVLRVFYLREPYQRLSLPRTSNFIMCISYDLSEDLLLHKSTLSS